MTNDVLKMLPKVGRKLAVQGELNLIVERQIVDEGIGMGVLRDGTSFLHQRGLARLCGVENRYIGLISSEWNLDHPSERTRRIREMLSERGEHVETAGREARFKGRRVLAYPDNICTVTLEYYAFEAGLSGREKALQSYRTLARHGLRQFIYSKVGYVAEKEEDVWRIFRDRVSLTYDAVPAGHFGIFKELSSLIVTLGLSGLHIDEHFVPDVSVGQAWAKHWDELALSKVHGTRASYPHNYPPYFPQAASNPQLAACYPENALGEFRRWFREDYIGEGRFKSYLLRKASTLFLSKEYIERAMLALTKQGI